MIKFFEYLTKSKFQCFFVILVFTVLLSILKYRRKSKVETFSTSIDCNNINLNGELEYYQNLGYCEKFKFLTCDTVMTKVNELFTESSTYSVNQTVCDNILKVYLENAYVLYQIYNIEFDDQTEVIRSFPDISNNDINNCKKLKFLLSGEFMYYVLIRLVKFNDNYKNNNIVFNMVNYTNNNLYNTITFPNVVEYNTSLHVKLVLNSVSNNLQYKQNALDSKSFKLLGDNLSVNHLGGELTATIHKEYTIDNKTYSMNPIEIKRETIPSRPSGHYLNNFENNDNRLYHFPFYIKDTTNRIYIKQNWDGGNIRGRHLLGDNEATSIFYLREFNHVNREGYKIFSNNASGDSLLCWDRGGAQSSPVVKQERCSGVTDNQIMFFTPSNHVNTYWTYSNYNTVYISDQRNKYLKRQLDNNEYKYKFTEESTGTANVFQLLQIGTNYYTVNDKTIVK